MTNAERQLLLLLAEAAVELLGNTFAASDEPMTALRLEIGYRLAEARQSALQASQGPDGIHDPHGAIRTASDASDAPRHSTGTAKP